MACDWEPSNSPHNFHLVVAVANSSSVCDVGRALHYVLRFHYILSLQQAYEILPKKPQLRELWPQDASWGQQIPSNPSN